MILLNQVLGWTEDTFLFQLDKKLIYEYLSTEYVLFNFPSEYDLFSFRGMIYPSNIHGELLCEAGDIVNVHHQDEICNLIMSFLMEKNDDEEENLEFLAPKRLKK